jgi:hypothetical protein
MGPAFKVIANICSDSRGGVDRSFHVLGEGPVQIAVASSACAVVNAKKRAQATMDRAAIRRLLMALSSASIVWLPDAICSMSFASEGVEWLSPVIVDSHQYPSKIM